MSGEMYGILGTIAAGDDFYKMSEQRKTEEEQVCLTKYHYQESATQNGSA